MGDVGGKGRVDPGEEVWSFENGWQEPPKRGVKNFQNFEF